MSEREVAYDGARWLARHAEHEIRHNERGFRCITCFGKNYVDATWLVAAVWNERKPTAHESNAIHGADAMSELGRTRI